MKQFESHSQSMRGDICVIANMHVERANAQTTMV